MSDAPSPVPMWSGEAETALLGAIINGGQPTIDAAADLVREEWFFAPVHRAAWQVLHGMYIKRQPVDLFTFTEAFRQAGELQKIEGGAGWLTANFGAAPGGVGMLTHWAEVVRDYWRRREIVRVATDLLIDAKDFAKQTEDVIDLGEKALLDLRLETKQTGLVHCAEAVDAAAKRIETAHKKRGGVIGIATGFTDLDRMTGGLKNGQLVIIAARPSMGKSAFATNIAEHACISAGTPTALFSLEMTGEELMERVLCTQSDVKLQRVRDGFMSKDEMKKLGQMIGEVSAAPLYLDETPSLTIAAFRARARRAVAKHGVKLLIVDYLQLMRGSSKRAQQDRRLEIDEISSGLKATAKELGVPVIALSQLNRDAEERAEPKLSHLRESGSIEQDADIVALLHRPERVTHKEEDKGKAVLILAKQRNGPVGRIELHFDGEITRFKNGTGKLYSNRKEERQQTNQP